MTTQNLLVELFVEELPPKALKKLGDAFAQVLADQLKAQGLASADAAVTAFASPRRLAVHVTGVADRAADKAVSQKLMPVSVGLTADGQATPALLKRLGALGADASVVPSLKRAPDGKAEALFFDSIAPGVALAPGLQKALDEALAKLPIPKVMTYQLETDCEQPGWSSVQFVRPAHGLVALHGSTVVPLKVLGLTSGNSTHGHRFEAAVDPVVLKDADSYAATLLQDGSVIASFEARKAEIARQLAAAAAKLGGGCQPIEDDALLEEVTALVERPNVLTCSFETEYLDVPQECLILTMKANQKYFPLLDAQGKLTNQFLVVSNISPDDASAVIQGNERVVRPRLADAKFFFDQDRKKTLASRVEGLGKVVYHNKLGTQGERVERVRAIARAIGQQLGGDVLAKSADSAAQLAKTDLLTDMVGEFPELQGIMGGYYARYDGLSEDIAFAIEDHYKPRFAGDELPRNMAGVVVALADKLETLVGMFGIGNLPTGDKDPFALRRHALGVIRMLVEKDLALNLADLIDMASVTFAGISEFKKSVVMDELEGKFIFDRLAGSLREQGASAQEVDAVLALRPQRLAEVSQRLNAVRAFAALAEAPALAAANKRIGNILKKSEGEGAAVDASLFVEAAEKDLYAAMQATVPVANGQFDAGDYTNSLQTLAALRTPVDAFFDGVMVNAEDPKLKANRLGLLKQLHEAMNRVADLSRLAS
ncbi:glycine--tRNA ligase subunit beta [Hydrogenophaga crassostreae]|uniref:Glycine--tRNA ligase beta subunit n=1 Tax=Hydrogenophaga crassostreae TaxID=1763535 RepID=A0A167GNH1_9BURK|nr:glycine--tRNA ligase subunit beta [Hydrogenophaga crassostreae]AOW14867.1 glycine--tRNA ligase subunit beta [Hydrogenophaga crassostreae]OAD39693.1 glycine--tRNA ligase subunit beta [Hydrogenophaga crassostreae]